MKRQLVDYARQEHDLSLRAACDILDLSRSVYHYRPDTSKDLPVIEAIQSIVEESPGWGFPKVFKSLRRKGYRWNHKRRHQIYCLLQLNKRRRCKRRVPTRNPLPLVVPESSNVC